MIERWQAKEVLSALGSRRVVNLTGVRQCGKTTLAESIHLPVARRFTLDDDKVRLAAQGDPQGFVMRSKGETLVIDEIQKAPELLNAIKISVDRDNERGQYLVTGSSNLHFAKAVKDSLAGRTGRIRLRTLALGEIRGGRGDFLDHAFNRDFPCNLEPLGKKDVIDLAVSGGYPETIEMDWRERRKWFAAYMDDLLMKDIRDLTEIRKVDALRNVAIWMLAHSSKFFDVSELSAKVGITRETAETYIAALKALYLFDEVRPWTKSDYSKIGRRSKYFATDAGLVANILGWTGETIYMDADRSGKMVETFVYQNLACIADAGLDYEITHYRDANKREIDFVVERMDGALLGIEVKAGSSLGAGDFKHLKWFAENLAKSPFTGIVLYPGENVLRFGEGFYAVPISCLSL